MLKPKTSNKELIALTINKLIDGLPDREINSKEEFKAYLKEISSLPPAELRAEAKKALAEARKESERCTYLY